MRSVVDRKYRLVENLIPGMSFPILEDVQNTQTWADITNEAQAGQPTGWVYDFDAYMKRPLFELFDLDSDPTQQTNLANSSDHAGVLARLKKELDRWREETDDPWLPCTSGTSTEQYCGH